MAQLQKKFIANNAVDEAKIRLNNAGNLKARNAADSGDVNILKVNASDRVEFASVPQTTADAVAANDLVRYSQLATLVEGLKPKQAVAVASTANIDLAVNADPNPIDGYTLLNGERILLKDQTLPEENGIYDAVTAANPTTWVRSSDFNNITEIPGSYTVAENGTAGQGVLYVTTSTPAIIGTDPIVFVSRASTSYVGHDMITISGSNVSVDLAAVSGLESSNPGNAAGQLRAKVHAATVKINGSNQLESLKENEELITLSGTDITNQYVDLSFAIYGTSASVNSAVLTVIGGLTQHKTVDYTVSLTGGGGGVTRITFAGDLATAGAAELIAGDILAVSYSYLT